MQWTVTIHKKIQKQIAVLPERARKSFALLMKEIEIYGPVRGNWPNYSAIGGNRHHCHIKKGNPVYVAVWEVIDKKVRMIEVIYAGTHEKAPY